MLLIVHSIEVTHNYGKLAKSVGPLRCQQILLDTCIKAGLLGDCISVTVFFLSFLFCRVFVKTSRFITCSFSQILSLCNDRALDCWCLYKKKRKKIYRW